MPPQSPRLQQCNSEMGCPCTTPFWAPQSFYHNSKEDHSLRNPAGPGRGTVAQCPGRCKDLLYRDEVAEEQGHPGILEAQVPICGGFVFLSLLPCSTTQSVNSPLLGPTLRFLVRAPVTQAWLHINSVQDGMCAWPAPSANAVSTAPVPPADFVSPGVGCEKSYTGSQEHPRPPVTTAIILSERHFSTQEERAQAAHRINN